MLKVWVEQGVLEPLLNRAKRNMAYTKLNGEGYAE